MSGSRTSHRKLSWLLVASGTALGGLVYQQAASAPGALPVVAANPGSDEPAATVSSDPVASLAPLADLVETIERPLFRKNRRPAAEPMPSEASEPVVVGSGYGLVGVTLFNGQRVALLKPESGGRLVRVREGQRLDRWRIARIEVGSVLLSQGGAQEEIRLRDAPRSRAAKRAFEPDTAGETPDEDQRPDQETQE